MKNTISTVTKTKRRGVNIFTVTNPAMKTWKREFISNKQEQAAKNYADWLEELATLSKKST